jgi:hypothetical protein
MSTQDAIGYLRAALAMEDEQALEHLRAFVAEAFAAIEAKSSVRSLAYSDWPGWRHWSRCVTHVEAAVEVESAEEYYLHLARQCAALAVAQ